MQLVISKRLSLVYKDHERYKSNNTDIEYQNRFSDQFEINKQFLEILDTYHIESGPVQGIYEQVTQLLNSAPDLVEYFNQFLPESVPHVKTQAACETLMTGPRSRPKRRLKHMEPIFKIRLRLEPNFKPKPNPSPSPSPSSVSSSHLGSNHVLIRHSIHNALGQYFLVLQA